MLPKSQSGKGGGWPAKDSGWLRSGNPVAYPQLIRSGALFCSLNCWGLNRLVKTYENGKLQGLLICVLIFCGKSKRKLILVYADFLDVPSPCWMPWFRYSGHGGIELPSRQPRPSLFPRYRDVGA